MVIYAYFEQFAIKVQSIDDHLSKLFGVWGYLPTKNLKQHLNHLNQVLTTAQVSKMASLADSNTLSELPQSLSCYLKAKLIVVSHWL